MNRAEARIRKFQNSLTRLDPLNDLSRGNDIMFANHEKAHFDGVKLARKFGRKNKK